MHNRCIDGVHLSLRQCSLLVCIVCLSGTASVNCIGASEPPASLRSRPTSTSKLWGVEGNKYVAGPEGRLLDFSYAGYAAGEAAIPNPPPTGSVSDYGAKGDGVTDDTKAFQAAIEGVKQGVLLIPEGRYVIRDFLNISTRLSLRGEGSNRTRLLFPQGLAELYGDVGEAVGRKNTSQWSFGTAFINYNGDMIHTNDTLIGSIKAFVRRGTNVVKVNRIGDIRVGQWVSLTVGNPRNSGNLFQNMNLGRDKGCSTDPLCFDKDLFTFQSRVAAIKDRTTLVLERPLPYNISVAFAPASLHRWAPQLANVGVQGITFEMLSKRYKGHFAETGFNALQLNNVSNGWVQDVKFIGADLALTMIGCSFMTVSRVKIDAPAERKATWMGRQWAGHHAFFTVRTVDTLVTDFHINVKYVHDLSVDYYSRGVVWSRGRGADLSMDHHKAQTYGILWTQLDLGLGTHPLECGGAKGRGLHAGSFTTFWNIDNRKARHPLHRKHKMPPDFGPALNFVGYGHRTDFPPLNLPLTRTWWVEKIAPRGLNPPNLFLAQQALRLSNSTHVSTLLGGKGSGGDLLTQY